MLAENNLEDDIRRIMNFNDKELDKITKEEVDEVKEKKGNTKTLINDVIFKSVFLYEPDILLKMIKDIFSITESINNPIIIVGYESVPLVYRGKTFKNDLLVKLSDSSVVVIEMNNRSRKGVLERNLIQLFRIHGQVLSKGEEYKNLDKYQIRGINFNYGFAQSKRIIDEYAFCNIETGEVASNIITFASIDVEKSTKLVYNNIEKRDTNIPLAAVWGSIMNENNVSKIKDILGGTLTMEQRERLAKRIEDINDDDRIMKDWMIEDNSRWYIDEVRDDGYFEGRKDGLEEGIISNTMEMIQNMLRKKTDYEYISEISGKTIEEIKEIEKGMKESTK